MSGKSADDFSPMKSRGEGEMKKVERLDDRAKQKEHKREGRGRGVYKRNEIINTMLLLL